MHLPLPQNGMVCLARKQHDVSSQCKCGSNVPILSAGKHFCSDPVQVQSQASLWLVLHAEALSHACPLQVDGRGGSSGSEATGRRVRLPRPGAQTKLGSVPVTLGVPTALVNLPG